MNKKGFTLQEALITVGIIGIVAAITVPAITKIIPNQYQTKYLKAYAAISSLTKDMLMDSNLYWYNSDGNNCDGLRCDTVPTPGSVPDELIRLITNNGQNNNPTWVQKYAAILAYNMQIQNSDLFRQNSAIFFTASDGTIWMFDNPIPNNILVEINVDQNANPAVEAIDANGNIPNVYRILVDNDGNVAPGDPYGRTYLDDPDRVHNKKDTIQIAEGRNDDVPTFAPNHYKDRVSLLCNNGYDNFCKIREYMENNDSTNNEEEHGINGN